MKSAADLEAIRKSKFDDMKFKSSKYRMRVVVGMATCGIAAGARPVMDAFLEEMKQRNISDVDVVMTGCIGVCMMEPMAEITDKEGRRFTYVRMTAEKAARVAKEHIVGGEPCVDLLIGAGND